MAQWDWSQFAVGGATRPDSFSGMNPQFSGALESLFSAAPPEIRQNLRVSSGYRSVQRQAELWEGALRKYGSPAAARKWVAPPGNSGHNKRHAADLKYLSDAARKWTHANAAQHNLTFPLSNENWHIELAGARGGKHQHDPAAVAPTIANMQNKTFDPVGEVMAAQGAGPSVASLFAGPAATPDAFAAVAAGADMVPTPNTFGGLALLFAQQQADRQKEREAEAQAEQARRVALFGGGGVAGLYG